MQNITVTVPNVTLVEENDRYRLLQNTKASVYVVEPVLRNQDGSVNSDLDPSDRRLFTSRADLETYLSSNAN